MDNIKDCLVRLMIFEISSSRNILYELDRNVKENLDKIDTLKLLNQFIEQNKTNDNKK